MPAYQEIYLYYADLYDALVRHEDHENNLARWLEHSIPRGNVVELGAGTGRVTRLLAQHAKTVRAYDGSAHMIETAQALLSGTSNVVFGVADNAALPEPDASADAVVAGWTIGHVTGYFPQEWEKHASAALDEMQRIGHANALHLVIETLGTCATEAAPPNARLAALYELFERRGLQRTTLSTDYSFDSVEEAARVMGFFFGATMEARVKERGSAIVPEWTGVWSGRLTASR